jgi:hypothetical protein
MPGFSALLDLPWLCQDIVVLPDGPGGAIIPRTLPELAGC